MTTRLRNIVKPTANRDNKVQDWVGIPLRGEFFSHGVRWSPPEALEVPE